MNPYPFFEELTANNNRAWFAANKTRYDDLRHEWIQGMERVKLLVADSYPEMSHVPVKTFRIYRDTRFTTDKTPYKTHLGSVLPMPGARNVHHSGAYVEIGIPDSDSGVFGGIWAPDAPSLKKLRHAIVDNIDEWNDIVNDPTLKKFFPDWFGERLKTAPKGWPKDHPQIEYLRLKHIGRESLMTRREFMRPDWTDAVAQRIIAIMPLLQFIDYSLNEE